MVILNDRQIRQKIKRLSIEILEHNLGETEIILAGTATLLRVLENLEVQELYYSAGGVRDGIIADLASRTFGFALGKGVVAHARDTSDRFQHGDRWCTDHA